MLLAVVFICRSCMLLTSPYFISNWSPLLSSGYTAVCGGLLYWLASLTPLRSYMLRDRSELDIV